MIIRSNKPEAKPFRKWITSEVLPQIRKTGGYIPVNEKMTDDEIILKSIEILKKTIEQKDNIIQEQKRVKAHITEGREGTLFSKTGILTKKVEKLEVELDKSKDYATVKRMELLYHGIKFNWRELKQTSALMNLPPINIYDANYGSVKSYHKDVWKECYALDII